jgi:hypothetical protein
MAVTYNQIAPRNAQGKPITAEALSESDQKLVLDAILAACDADDGLKDGMIFNPIACKFDPETLVCKGAKAEGCLSAQPAPLPAPASHTLQRPGQSSRRRKFRMPLKRHRL